jgi:hypothetical protein
MGYSSTHSEIRFTILPHRQKESESILSAYPNPGTEILNIQLNVVGKTSQIQIIDLSGNKVLTKNNLQNNKGILSIDVSELKSKPYIIKVVTDKEVKQLRWIKE